MFLKVTRCSDGAGSLGGLLSSDRSAIKETQTRSFLNQLLSSAQVYRLQKTRHQERPTPSPQESSFGTFEHVSICVARMLPKFKQVSAKEHYKQICALLGGDDEVLSKLGSEPAHNEKAPEYWDIFKHLKMVKGTANCMDLRHDQIGVKKRIGFSSQDGKVGERGEGKTGMVGPPVGTTTITRRDVTLALALNALNMSLLFNENVYKRYLELLYPGACLQVIHNARDSPVLINDMIRFQESDVVRPGDILCDTFAYQAGTANAQFLQALMNKDASKGENKPEHMMHQGELAMLAVMPPPICYPGSVMVAFLDLPKECPCGAFQTAKVGRRAKFNKKWLYTLYRLNGRQMRSFWGPAKAEEGGALEALLLPPEQQGGKGAMTQDQLRARVIFELFIKTGDISLLAIFYPEASLWQMNPDFEDPWVHAGCLLSLREVYQELSAFNKPIKRGRTTAKCKAKLLYTPYMYYPQPGGVFLIDADGIEQSVSSSGIFMGSPDPALVSDGYFLAFKPLIEEKVWVQFEVLEWVLRTATRLHWLLIQVEGLYRNHVGRHERGSKYHELIAAETVSVGDLKNTVITVLNWGLVTDGSVLYIRGQPGAREGVPVHWDHRAWVDTEAYGASHLHGSANDGLSFRWRGGALEREGFVDMLSTTPRNPTSVHINILRPLINEPAIEELDLMMETGCGIGEGGQSPQMCTEVCT